MRRQNVLAVADEIQRTDLPVRLGAPAMRRRQHLHALRRARQERIDVPGYVAEIFGERNDVRIPAAEDQSLVDFEARNARQSVFGKIEILRKVSVERRRHQPAGPLVGPAVIRTDEMTRVAGIRRDRPWRRDAGSCSTAHASCHRCRARRPPAPAHVPGNKIARLQESQSRGPGTPRCDRKSVPFRAGRSSSLTKISRLTSPRCTSTQSCVSDARESVQTCGHPVKYHLLFKLVQCTVMWQAAAPLLLRPNRR